LSFGQGDKVRVMKPVWSKVKGLWLMTLNPWP